MPDWTLRWLLLAGGRRRQAAEQAKAEIQKSLNDTKQIVADYQQQFGKKKAELQAAYNRYLRLDQEKREQLQKLEAKKRELQLNEFLDKILIRDYDIPEIKDKRKQALQAYGIESAFDVSYSMKGSDGTACRVW